MDSLIPFFQANLLLSLALLGLTLALVITEVMRLFRGFKGISPSELTHLINNENALVLDIRGQADFEKGHIISSRHMLPSQVDPESKLLAKARENPVVVVCAAGMTAAGVASRLVKAGFKRVSVLDGGIGAWQQAGLPLARGKA